MTTQEQTEKHQKLENRNEKKTTEWILQATNWPDCTRESPDMV